MEPKISKLAKIVSAVVIALGAILTLLLMIKGDDAIKENPDSTNALLNLSYFALFSGVGIALFSAVFGMLKNPGALKKTLMGVGFIIVIYLISYLIADGSDWANYKDVTQSEVKLVSTGLNMFYIIGVIAIGSVAWSSFGRILK
jgi:hypothetical protein